MTFFMRAYKQWESQSISLICLCMVELWHGTFMMWVVHEDNDTPGSHTLTMREFFSRRKCSLGTILCTWHSKSLGFRAALSEMFDWFLLLSLGTRSYFWHLSARMIRSVRLLYLFTLFAVTPLAWFTICHSSLFRCPSLFVTRDSLAGSTLI